MISVAIISPEKSLEPINHDNPFASGNDALDLCEKFFLTGPYPFQFIVQAGQTHLLIHTLILSQAGFQCIFLCGVQASIALPWIFLLVKSIAASRKAILEAAICMGASGMR